MSWKLEALSRVHFEGEELLGVHVVERTQLGELEQQLGEGGGRLLAVVMNHQVPQTPDQLVLQGLNGAQVLNPRAICVRGREGEKGQCRWPEGASLKSFRFI